MTTGSEPLERLRAAVDRLAQATQGRALTGLSHDDADDIVGSVATDGAIGFDPFPLLEALSRHGAEIVVMGQVAGIMHGSTELTGDLDLIWEAREDQTSRLATAFASVGATLTDADHQPVPCDAEAFRLPKVYFESPTVTGDCCTTRLPWGDLDVESIIRRAETTTAAGLTVRYVSREDLITMRRTVGRVKDERRAQELEHLVLCSTRTAMNLGEL